MSDKTGIEWTDATWNPLRGCSRVSDGCRNCYAETVANRFKGEGQPYEGLIARGGQWNGQIKLVPELLDQPLRWRRPRRIFVNSMSDLFHENVREDFIDRIFAVMAMADRHTFQILTKRPERMLDYCRRLQVRADEIAHVAVNTWGGVDPDGLYDWVQDCVASGPLPNVWLGVSVENQKTADERIPLLLQTPAAVRWISAEPLLGPISMRWFPAWPENAPTTAMNPNGSANHLDGLRRLDWVIVGGESGRGARAMHPDWARVLRDQCAEAGVPFLFKQWGEWAPRGPESMGYPLLEGVPRLRLTDAGQNGQDLATDGGNHVWMQRAGKKTTGRLLDGIQHDDYPQVPA